MFTDMNIILRLHILKDGKESYQFILLCDRSSFVNDVKQKIQSTYKSLYPDKGNINVVNIKDEENYDIPNEYCIGDIFQGNSKVLVECNSVNISTVVQKDNTYSSIDNEENYVPIDTVEIGKTTLPQHLSEHAQPSLKRSRSSFSEQSSQKKLNAASDEGIESSGFIYRPTNARDSISSVTSINHREDALPSDDENYNNITQPNLVSDSTENGAIEKKEHTVQETSPIKDNIRGTSEEVKTLSDSPRKLSQKQTTPSPSKQKKGEELSQLSAASPRITRSSKRLELKKERTEAPAENSKGQMAEQKQEHEDHSTTSESEEEEIEEPSVLAPEIVVHETPSHPSTAVPSENEDSSSDSGSISGSSSVSVSSSSSSDLSEESDDVGEQNSISSSKERLAMSNAKETAREEISKNEDVNTSTGASNANIQDAGKKFRQISQNSDTDSEPTTESSSESESESDSSIPLSQRAHPPSAEVADTSSKNLPSKITTRSKSNTQKPEPQRTLSYSRLSELSKTFSPEIKDPMLRKDEPQKSDKNIDSKDASKEKEQQSSSESEENDSDEESSSSESDAPMQEKANPIPLEKRASAAVPQKKRGRGRPRKSTGLAGLAALA
ncbi:nucleolar protein Dnt1 [Schizosaccharomyces cryophilus OY26]|uniref:Nucleolar protein Dnt1 n=1 Tax=Schizosaccharomyces cryophilus (strain OY26 / ATCC MYA-4695 / CBS 11777 / NBRC 106824 / NRRL Y48691) TaxID=653667 RepID=S9W736_SCHCR|nr:nucleolar protein Dnt1 [Schizosaccharomyces cryophilus OY26]EPY53695.1 nucleolar protein Dnt1 [Schizosaccharomyces cryophilus OY26]